MSGITKTAMAALLLANEGEARLLRHQKAASAQSCVTWAKAAQKPKTCSGCMGGGSEGYTTGQQAFCATGQVYDEAATECVKAATSFLEMGTATLDEATCKKLDCCQAKGKVMDQFASTAKANTFCAAYGGSKKYGIKTLATGIGAGACSTATAKQCSNCTSEFSKQTEWANVIDTCCTETNPDA